MPVMPRWMRSSWTSTHLPPERSRESFACARTRFHVFSPRLFRFPSRRKSCSTSGSASSALWARNSLVAVDGSPMRPAELRRGDTCQAMSVVLIRLPSRSLRRNTCRRPLRSEARRRARPRRTKTRFSSASGMRSARVPSVTRSSRENAGASLASSRASTRETNVSSRTSISVRGLPEKISLRDDCWSRRRLFRRARAGTARSTARDPKLRWPRRDRMPSRAAAPGRVPPGRAPPHLK